MFSKAGTLTGSRWGKSGGSCVRWGKACPSFEQHPVEGTAHQTFDPTRVAPV